MQCRRAQRGCEPANSTPRPEKPQKPAQLGRPEESSHFTHCRSKIENHSTTKGIVASSLQLLSVRISDSCQSPPTVVIEADALRFGLRLTGEWSSTQLGRQHVHLLAPELAHSSDGSPMCYILSRGRRDRGARYPLTRLGACGACTSTSVVHRPATRMGERAWGGGACAKARPGRLARPPPSSSGAAVTSPDRCGPRARRGGSVSVRPATRLGERAESGGACAEARP